MNPHCLDLREREMGHGGIGTWWLGVGCQGGSCGSDMGTRVAPAMAAIGGRHVGPELARLNAAHSRAPSISYGVCTQVGRRPPPVRGPREGGDAALLWGCSCGVRTR